MSSNERVVFLDRAAFTADELPIPSFDHNWSEYPDTEAADVMPRLFWATTAITHACPLDAAAIGQLHKLRLIVATGSAVVDLPYCKIRGIVVRKLTEGTPTALIRVLETGANTAIPR